MNTIFELSKEETLHISGGDLQSGVMAFVAGAVTLFAVETYYTWGTTCSCPKDRCTNILSAIETFAGTDKFKVTIDSSDQSPQAFRLEMNNTSTTKKQ
jgi:hypothetical protein